LGAGATAAGAAAAGALAGAAAGGLLGALAGLGIPEEEARYYEGEFKSGRTLVTVKAGDRYDEAWRILERFGAYDVHHQRTGSTLSEGRTRDMGTSGQVREGTVYTPSGQRRSWDQDKANWRDRWQNRYGRSGGSWEDVEVYYVFAYEQMQDPRFQGRRFNEAEPDLRRDWESRGQRGTWQEANPYIREMWESDQPTTASSMHQQQPMGTSTSPTGQTMGSSAGGRSWNDVSPEWRNRWQSRYGSSGGRWEDNEPYYRYGYESSNNPQYQGRNFNDVEPQLRRDWESRNPTTPWDRIRDFVRQVFESGRRVS
jgi:hypothetical protein